MDETVGRITLKLKEAPFMKIFQINLLLEQAVQCEFKNQEFWKWIQEQLLQNEFEFVYDAVTLLSEIV